MVRDDRAIYVTPGLAHTMYGVNCAQAFLMGTVLVYRTPDGVWVTMMGTGKRQP